MEIHKKSDGSYKIINCKTGKALDSGGANNNLYVYSDCDNECQSWFIYGSSGDYYLSSRATDYVIDLAGGYTEDGTNVQMFEKNGTYAQKFQIWKLDDWNGLGVIKNVGDDFYAYIINTEAWKHLTNEDDNNVDMRVETAAYNQIWHFELNDDGSYTIKNLATNLFLDASDVDGNLCVAEYTGNSYQKWYIFGESAAWFLKSKHGVAANVIDIAGGSQKDGANAQIFTFNGTSAQKFQIWELVISPVMGDANSDGKVSVADVIMLQKWLLGAGDLTNWMNADLYEDGVIDVFDLAALKRMVLSQE